MTIIDVHAHIVPDDLGTAIASFTADTGLEWSADGDTRHVTRDGATLRVFEPIAWDPAARIEVMDAEGTAQQVLSPVPLTLFYGVEPEAAQRIARYQNEFIASVVADQPDRFVGFGTVPLQDPTIAVEEATFARSLGLRGLEIGPHVGDRELSDPAFEPFFAAVEALDLSLFVHPVPGSRYEALTDLGLQFGMANPMRTTEGAGALLWGGVMDAHPRLRVCLAHGGGCLPSIAHRLHAGYERMERNRGSLAEPPREALRRFWVDSLVYDADALVHTASVFGRDRVVVGSDFPFRMRETPPGAALDRAVRSGSIADDDAERIRSGNANAFLGR